MTFLHSWSHYTPSWAHSAHKHTILNKKKMNQNKESFGRRMRKRSRMRKQRRMNKNDHCLLLQCHWGSSFPISFPEHPLRVASALYPPWSSATFALPMVQDQTLPWGLRRVPEHPQELTWWCGGIIRSISLATHWSSSSSSPEKKSRNLVVLPPVLFACLNSQSYCWKVCPSAWRTWVYAFCSYETSGGAGMTRWTVLIWCG